MYAVSHYNNSCEANSLSDSTHLWQRPTQLSLLQCYNALTMPTPKKSPETTNQGRIDLVSDIVERYSSQISKDQLFVTKLRDPVAAEIVSTDAFKRLKDIAFLGAISYVRSTTAEAAAAQENRYNHSLGVAAIAESFANFRELTKHERKMIVVAGLLHDIGHPPLSHSAEPSFMERFGDDHHSMTEKIIRGEKRFDRRIPRILKIHGLDLDKIIALLNGEVQIGGLNLFKGPFNVDTVEGISRCSNYMSRRLVASVAAPIMVLLAACDRKSPESIAVLDNFWHSKDLVYNTLIRSQTGIIADKIANDYFKRYRGKLSKDIMVSTESKLMKQHSRLCAQLYTFAPSRTKSSRVIEYVKRTFVINHEEPATNLQKRYTHLKTTQFLYY